MSFPPTQNDEKLKAISQIRSFLQFHKVHFYAQDTLKVSFPSLVRTFAQSYELSTFKRGQLNSSMLTMHFKDKEKPTRQTNESTPESISKKSV